jgi:hypothetical protein
MDSSLLRTCPRGYLKSLNSYQTGFTNHEDKGLKPLAPATMKTRGLSPLLRQRLLIALCLKYCEDKGLKPLAPATIIV